MTITIRPSSLTTAADCGRRWAAHSLADMVSAGGYVLAVQRPVHVGAAVGSGVHAGAAYTMTEKKTTGDLGAESEAIDRAEHEFMERGEYGLSWDATTSDLSTAKKQLARMTRTYRRYVAPLLAPLLVEERLVADIGDGWQVSGQLDTLAGDPDNIIDDLKTGVFKRANGVQYATYAMLFRAHGYLITGIVEDYIKRAPLAHEQPKPERIEIDLEPAIADAWELMEGLKQRTAEFQRRLADPSGRSPPHAFPANPASVLCGAKWCRAWGTSFCRAHQ